MSRRKKRLSGAEVITLSGVAGPTGADGYQRLVEKVTKKADKAQRCGCIRPYRGLLDAALGTHITLMLEDAAEAEHLNDEAREQQRKLESCLRACKRR